MFSFIFISSQVIYRGIEAFNEMIEKYVHICVCACFYRKFMNQVINHKNKLKVKTKRLHISTFFTNNLKRIKNKTFRSRARHTAAMNDLDK